jgi:uncharacterized phiE125 gp8 family phage protein
MLSLVTASSGEPLDLETVKQQCALIGIDDKDEMLKSLTIPSARDRGQLATRRQFMTATWDWYLDCFPSCTVIEMPKPPLQSVTFIKYYDEAGVQQTFDAANYIVQVFNGERCARGRVALVPFIPWPLTQAGRIGAVQIRFQCGYGTAKDVPPQLKAAMLLDISTALELTENVITGTIVSPVPLTSSDIYRSFKSYGTQFLEDDDEAA